MRGIGKTVVGIGGENASLSFRQSCDIFHFIAHAAKAPKAADSPSLAKTAAVPSTPPLLPIVQDAIRKLKGEASDGWVSLGRLGAMLRVVKPGFQSKTYGAGSLKKMLGKEPALELETRNEGDFVRIRLKVDVLSV